MDIRATAKLPKSYTANIKNASAASSQA